MMRSVLLNVASLVAMLIPDGGYLLSRSIRTATFPSSKHVGSVVVFRTILPGTTNGQSDRDRLVAQGAANHYWDLFHLDLKTAFLQGEHYNLSSRMVAVQLPPDIGLPPWMVGLCLRPVYGLNDAPRRWWKRLDKFLRSVGLGPTRADRCAYDTYVAYDGTQEREPEPEPPGYLKEIVLHAMSCYTYDEASRAASDGAEERSYMSCPDIAQCFNTETKKMVDYAWRLVADQKLLGFLGGVVCKKGLLST